MIRFDNSMPADPDAGPVQLVDEERAVGARRERTDRFESNRINQSNQIIESIESDRIDRADERFRVKKLIGGGGFGRIFLAYDVVGAQEVALKVAYRINKQSHDLQVI